MLLNILLWPFRLIFGLIGGIFGLVIGLIGGVFGIVVGLIAAVLSLAVPIAIIYLIVRLVRRR